MVKITLPKTSAPRAPAPPKTAIPAPPPIPEAGIPAPPAPSLSRSKPAPPPPDFLKLKPTPALVKLKQNADTLNAITDSASASVKSIEEFLSKECSIGFHSYVLVRDADEDSQEIIYLEYRRIGTKYRIAIVEADVLDPERELARAWSDCPRNLKIETIEKLPDLIDKITEQVESEIVSANDAMQTVNNVLKSLIGNEG